MMILEVRQKQWDLPVEAWKFAPDPLGLNAMQCECSECRRQRRSYAGYMPVAVKWALPGGLVSQDMQCTAEDAESAEERAGSAVHPELPSWLIVTARACAWVLAMAHVLVVRRWVLRRGRG